jgi:hypothetical protein
MSLIATTQRDVKNMDEKPPLYHWNGSGNYWVVSRAGYDLIAFTTEAEARAEYGRLVAAERAAGSSRRREVIVAPRRRQVMPGTWTIEWEIIGWITTPMKLDGSTT